MSDPTIIITAELEIRHNIDVITGKDAIIKFCEDMLSEPGCSMAVAHQSKANPRRFILWEKYQDQTAFDAHFNSEHTQAFFRSEITELIQAFETKSI